MHLKHARYHGKLEEFISEKEKTHPKASHFDFHATVKSMSAGHSKPKPAASRKARRGD